MTSPDVYEFSLASSGKVKLRATAKLAEGSSEATFEACVLLHEAARIERRAIEALPSCPSTARLAASIEECWCLLEGRDPPRAGDVWGRLLREKEEVDEPTAKAMLSRLAPRYEHDQRDFAKVVARCPTLLRLRAGASVAAASASERQSGLDELGRLLGEYPGATGFWWMTYRLAEGHGDKKRAWDALTRSRQLEPENPRFEAMSFLVAAWALPRAAAEQHIARARGSFDRAGAEVCLMYAFAEITLARSGPPAKRREHWRRSLDAAQAGLAQAGSEGIRRNLKAAQLLLQALLAGRRPTMDILYLAGLGELAVTANPSADVAELLTARVREAA
jgi:hypothetical protein